MYERPQSSEQKMEFWLNWRAKFEFKDPFFRAQAPSHAGGWIYVRILYTAEISGMDGDRVFISGSKSWGIDERSLHATFCWVDFEASFGVKERQVLGHGTVTHFGEKKVWWMRICR